MKHKTFVVSLITLVALVLLPGMANFVNAQQDRQTFSKEDIERAKKAAGQSDGKQAHALQPAPSGLGCRGPITQVLDVADENVRFTGANYFTNPGGGQGAGFDKTPLLTTKVQLAQGTCLDAHLSAIVGSKQSYGVAALTMFQVTLTPVGGGPRHMVGHYHTPFGMPSPAVALEAERDVDMLGANFFQRVGMAPHDVPPGVYRVDVWWSGAGPGGAIGAAFVLKLYMR
ncbi:MAG TPA: hypothetical protein VNO50_18850 [Pyrinomonadaceae bacterium]|nr:hypothetical protein [Pyrinomonadaceae bacterium]